MSGKTDPGKEEKKRILNISIDLILKLGGLFIVIFLCYKIVQPFISILLWSLIIAIVLFPLLEWLSGHFRGRKKLASLLITLVGLSVLVLPSIWLVNQLVDGVKYLADTIPEGNLQIPPPTGAVADWPLIGQWVYDNWMQASENLGESLKGFMPQISNFAEKLLGAIANTGMGILQFALSVILAGIFMVYFKNAERSGKLIFEKVAGDKGEEFLDVSLTTIRNVATGVLGVAIIQTTLMGLGLILADIPLAAVWIIILLIMTIAQIPAILFNIPLIIYLFAFMDPLPAALWTVYFLLMGLIDNILKPIIMGKDANVPMLVIFFGAIGGFIAFGFMGLFLGAIILSLAYMLYVKWVEV
ncbi:MAG TPA: AI-2E family transporter [Bacteroidetes bacterium]|nr:AI-2E family transporter [Bacteroidota bacterium]